MKTGSKYVISLLILASSFAVNANKIVTSTTTIASLVGMLTGDAVEVVAINDAPQCPHHYQMKPSDKRKIMDATIFIYIDDSFDSFATKLSEKFEGKVVKISDFKTVNFLDENGIINWHFWLDLNNALAFAEEIAKILIVEMPGLESAVKSNKNKARLKIESLIQLKKHELFSIKNIVVVSDSLEHFFNGIDSGVIKLYRKTYSSLKDYNDLKYILGNDTPQCIVIDSNQDDNVYKKFNKKIIKLESENWINDDTSLSTDLFCTKYLKMIHLLRECDRES